MIPGHILKFISNDQPKLKQGKLCTPSQTYGYSIQSPDWFKRKFSLPSKGGYQYKFDDPKFKEKFKYLSQNNQLKVFNFDNNILNKQVFQNNLIHNRKKGLLSEYMDKNAWMKTVVPLTGAERGQDARKLNNTERNKCIQTIRLKKSNYIASKTMSNFYSTKKQNRFLQRNRQIYSSQNERNSQQIQKMNNPELLKIDFTQTKSNKKNIQNSNNNFFGQKQRIKSARNELALNKIHSIEKIKFNKLQNDKTLKQIDRQFVQNTMTITARQWGQGKNISPSKTIERFQQMISKINSTQISKRSNRNFFNEKINNLLKEDNNNFILKSKKYSQQL